MYGDRWWFSGEQTSAMRDDALASGIDTINGITITHDYAAVGDQDLTTWYTNDVSGGTDAFVIEAASFSDFSTALTTKLTAEIEGGLHSRGSRGIGRAGAPQFRARPGCRRRLCLVPGHGRVHAHAPRERRKQGLIPLEKVAANA